MPERIHIGDTEWRFTGGELFYENRATGIKKSIRIAHPSFESLNG
jgi:hypothetical protein